MNGPGVSHRSEGNTRTGESERTKDYLDALAAWCKRHRLTTDDLIELADQEALDGNVE